MIDFLKKLFGGPQPMTLVAPLREAVGVQVDEDEESWTRLSADGSGANTRDLSPMSQDRMQKLAEWLWQSNLLANRVVEIPLAYLLAEGVSLQCDDDEHQKVLNAFWDDPINAWPLKLTARVRDLSLFGEQCYASFVNEADGAVRFGYVDPRRIGEVVCDPDNPEQPIGVLTKKDAKGRYKKYRVIVLGPEEVFSARTRQIRAGFGDGAVFLFQVNKLATGSRGRSDLLAQVDWMDAYDEFLFGELDRAVALRQVVWDLNVKTATEEQVKERAKTFKPPTPNSVYVHNDGEELTPKVAELQAADMSEGARLFRNHVLAGATVPEHWFGGGGDVNRAAAGEMGEPAYKTMTARQSLLKLMLESIGRYVLMQQPGARPDWSDPKWKVTAKFPELVNRDVTKFAAAMREVAAAVILLIGKGLLTEERGLKLVADIAARFGQEIDAVEELKKAKEEAGKRAKDQADADAFTVPPGNEPPQVGKPGDAGAGGQP